jgi:hypothetical protein
MPLVPQLTLHDFDKWEFDFIGPINPPEKISGERYIITTMDYLTIWAEAELIIDCNMETIKLFMFENVVIRFGCLRIIMSHYGTHFLNKKIAYLIMEFHIHHQKSTPYHP